MVVVVVMATLLLPVLWTNSILWFLHSLNYQQSCLMILYMCQLCDIVSRVAVSLIICLIVGSVRPGGGDIGRVGVLRWALPGCDS